jgi:DHA1 family bicyclomycin/chloramphenicol resistance-like MFS transporter
VLTLNMFMPALPRMAVAFGVSEATMGLAVSAYMVAAGVLQLILGPISDYLGRRPVILGALAVYALASLGATLATDFTVFLACRLVQALVMAGSIVGLAALRDMYATREAAGKMGTDCRRHGHRADDRPGGRRHAGHVDRLARDLRALHRDGGGLPVPVWIDWGETRVQVRRSPREQVAAYRALLGAGLFWAYSMCTAMSVGTFYIFLTGAPFVALAVSGCRPRGSGSASGRSPGAS